MENTAERIKESGRQIASELKNMRRHLHQHPELGFKEFETGKYIADVLSKLGLEVKTGVAKTGVVGLLRGSKPGKTVAIRADIDALPICEINDLPFKSVNEGVMHACGHDAHMTFALGAAMILSKMKDELSGNVKFIFQPAEETTGGAKPMIEEGVLENPKVDFIIGGHVWGSIPVGQIRVKHGPIMASTDFFDLKIIGKGGHAAYPHKSIDPVIMGSEIVTAFQKIVSRQTDPFEPLVVTIGAFQAGDAHNVIPHEAVIKGTVRTLNNDIRSSMAERLEKIIKGIVEPYGGRYEFKYIYNFPATVNNNEVTEQVKISAAKIVGEENVGYVERPSMGAEDYSFFLEKVPGTYIWIGVRNEDEGIVNDIHNPEFNIDERVLEIGADVYVQAALDLLK